MSHEDITISSDILKTLVKVFKYNKFKSTLQSDIIYSVVKGMYT